MSRLPLDFPPLVALAIDAANDVHSAALLVVLAEHGGVSGSLGPAAVTIKAHARLLSDLTRPDNRDKWLRWLGAALGWPESVHCPDWVFDDNGDDDLFDEPSSWVLRRYSHAAVFCAHAPGLPSNLTGIPNLDVSSPDAWPVALGQVIQYVAAQQVPK